MPFRSGRKFSAALLGDELAIKGAPEVVLASCADLDPAAERTVDGMARDGLRVLAVARRPLTAAQAGRGRSDADKLAKLCGRDLQFVGLLGLSDTPRAEAAQVLESLRDNEIGVCLITGDHPVTAKAIAAELGLPVGAEQVISGEEWVAMPRRSQEKAVQERRVFARMSPEHKVQIVQTLERTGLVCAMVGDGANDAAAIRAATVGIGVAARGSDPARSSADVLLLDGRIGALIDALDEGHQLWRRVQAAVAVLLGGNAGEVVFSIVGSALTGRSPLNTRQLLLVNMMTDALPAAALAVSPSAHRDRRGPRPRSGRVVADGGDPRCSDSGRGHGGLGDRGLPAGTQARLHAGSGGTGLHPAGPDPDRLAQSAGGRYSSRIPGVSGGTDQHARGQSDVGMHTARSARMGARARRGGCGHRCRRRCAEAVTPDSLRCLGHRFQSSSIQSSMSSTPQRHSTAYSSRNGRTRTRDTASVNGSDGVPEPEVLIPFTVRSRDLQESKMT